MMTSTEVKLGLTANSRPSSRVLKPPGGGHSNIFSDPEVSVNAPRPKYNQQNSSNLNACMGSTDPNQVVEKLREEITHVKGSINNIVNDDTTPPAVQNKRNGEAHSNVTNNNITNNTNNGAPATSTRGRIPPGGFSSGGFW